MTDQISQLLQNVEIPPVHKIRQRFASLTLEQPESILRQQLETQIPASRLAGQRIAITCGSRGIDLYLPIVRTLVAFLRDNGASPILIPAMGSHGGATAEGQRHVLAELGITEETTGAPICSSMDVREIGRTAKGLPVYIDRLACEADGIILLNRIKPHTSFRGHYESGLLKMLAIGLAKQAGAEMTHCLRYENMARNIVDVGTIALKHLNILGAVGTLENGYGHVASIHVLQADEVLAREPELLRRAWDLMPRIYLDEIDVLIVGEIGKDISGTGMDTNIVGRFHTQAASGGPNTIKLGLLDLSARSGGNANGMGMADFVTRRLYNRIDFTATYINTLTSTEPNSSRLPMVLADDRQVLQACCKLCGQLDPTRIRLAIIRNTKQLDEIWLSPAALQAAVAPDCLEVLSASRPLAFDSDGNLTLFGRQGQPGETRATEGDQA